MAPNTTKAFNAPTESMLLTSTHLPLAESTGWLDTSLHTANLILTTLTQAAAASPEPFLQAAAGSALAILSTIQAIRENKENFQRLGSDLCGIVYHINCVYDKNIRNGKQLSQQMRQSLVGLSGTLQSIDRFVQAQLKRGKLLRILYSRGDLGKIQEYRERLNAAMVLFEFQNMISIHETILQMAEQQREMLIEMRNQAEEAKREREAEEKRKQDTTLANIQTSASATPSAQMPFGMLLAPLPTETMSDTHVLGHHVAKTNSQTRLHEIWNYGYQLHN